MNNHISLATIAPQSESVLDADWIPDDDVDLIQKHLELLDKLHHADDVTPAELAERIRGARRSIRRNCRRARTQSQFLTAFVQRFFVGSVAFFGLAVTMALLVG